MTATKVSLKGSKLWGEFKGQSTQGEFLYRLASGKFAIVEKALWSGRILKVTEVEGSRIEKCGTLDLGYAIANLYRFKN